jgi:DNA polymerase-3 subunit epsilon
MTRFVAIDFETATPYDRIVEIGCVEIIDGQKTGREFYRLVNPKIPNRMICFGVHGLPASELKSEPPFAKIVDELLAFIADAPIIAHAEYYERNTLCNELERLQRSPLDRSRFVCTLQMARNSGHFTANGLEFVCDKLGIRHTRLRPPFHDALSDARMAADVYLRLAQSGLRGQARFSRVPIKPTVRRTIPLRDPGAISHTLVKSLAKRRRIARKLLYEDGDVSGYIVHLQRSLSLMGH